jgi:hypothetical protein
MVPVVLRRARWSSGSSAAGVATGTLASTRKQKRLLSVYPCSVIAGKQHWTNVNVPACAVGSVKPLREDRAWCPPAGLAWLALLELHQLASRRMTPPTRGVLRSTSPMYQPTAGGAASGAAEGTSRISGRTWRRVGGLAVIGIVIAALASGDHGSSRPASPGPSRFPTRVDVAGDSAQDPAAELERQRQAVQSPQRRPAAAVRRRAEHGQLAQPVAPSSVSAPSRNVDSRCSPPPSTPCFSSSARPQRGSATRGGAPSTRLPRFAQAGSGSTARRYPARTRRSVPD